jgi:hypothetical protein
VRLLLLLAAAAVATPFAAAALTTVVGGPVGTGSAVVAACDPDGFGVSFTTAGGSVTAVTITGIADPGCDGGVLRVEVLDDSGASIGSGGPVTVAADPNTSDATVEVAPAPVPLAASARRVQIVVDGP